MIGRWPDYSDVLRFNITPNALSIPQSVMYPSSGSMIPFHTKSRRLCVDRIDGRNTAAAQVSGIMEGLAYVVELHNNNNDHIASTLY